VFSELDRFYLRDTSRINLFKNLFNNYVNFSECILNFTSNLTLKYDTWVNIGCHSFRGMLDNYFELMTLVADIIYEKMTK